MGHTNQPPSPRARHGKWLYLPLKFGLVVAALFFIGGLLFLKFFGDTGGTTHPPGRARADGLPEFVKTAYPTAGLPPNPGLRQRFWVAYINFQQQHGKKNPSVYSFGPQPERACSIHGLLNQCMAISGTEYLIANEVAAGGINFGYTNSLSGSQWIAAFEATLQTNRTEWYNVLEKRMQRETLLVIREKPGLVKVLPRSRLTAYQQARLVDDSFVPPGKPDAR